MQRRTAVVFVCLCLFGRALGTSAVWAQAPASGSEPTVTEKAGKQFHAFRITRDSPQIDGKLDEDLWKLAGGIDDLVQDEPENMMPPRERTVIQVAYDDRYLYVAAHCYVQDPSQISAGLGRRGNFPPSDRLWIAFDPRHDHLTGYVFQTNPSGVQGDFGYVDDTRQDNDYEAVWEVATQVTAEGWDAEFRIPFSQMRFGVPPGDQSVWGFNARRDMYLTGEYDEWVPRPRGAQGTVSRFGHLVFGDRLAPPRRVELLPFTLTQIEKASSKKAHGSVNAGLDFRLGLGTSGTLSATIYPDFGQVEADPSVLNLSVFETFFPEKRPFFLEDSQTFVTQFQQFPDFYSRRIGQTPGRFELTSNETLVSKPDQTKILGATKITGKASGWTYGGLGALTDREFATVDQTITDASGTSTIRRIERIMEPRTLYGVGRVQRDLFHGSSTVGAMTTAVVREKDLDAYTGGVDYNFRWARNRYSVSGHTVGTHAPISGTGRSGLGTANNFIFNGKNLTSFVHVDHFGRNFRNADLGFLRTRPNKNDTTASLNLGQPDPWKMFRSIWLSSNAGRQWTDKGLVFGEWVSGGLNMDFTNFWNLNFNVQRNFQRFDDLDTRGGPPILRAAGDTLNVNVTTDSRKRWGVTTTLSGGRDESGAWEGSISPTLRLQPSSRLQTSLSVSHTVAQDVAQWIVNKDADGDGIEDNVYGRLHRDVLSITGRATYAFSRDMTLEAYLQPFVAVGDYTDIRKLARPRSFDFTPVSLTDDPDFNKKSLRGTIVLRWEYIRGSTLFVVWNLSTSDETRPGVFSPLRDLGSTFTGEGANVLAVKVNYWFTP